MYTKVYKQKGLLFSLLKEQQHGKVSLNNIFLGIYYKLLINMLMKQLYIAVHNTFILLIKLLWREIIKLFTHQLQLQKVIT